MNPLFQQPLQVISLGLAGFSDNLRAAGGKVLHLNWKPAAEGDSAANWLLANLFNDPRIEAANRQALQHLLDAQPVLVDVMAASEALPAMGGGQRLILHAGPPIPWGDMCGPMQGAIAGAILLEGWASDIEAAAAMAQGGEVVLQPGHHHSAVGPMAGIISPSMPLWVVENRANGNRAFSNFNEGLGKVLRFGANGDEVLTRLRWMRDVLAPTVRQALRSAAM